MWQRIKTVLGNWPVTVGLVIVLFSLLTQVVAINSPGSTAARLLERLDTLVYDWRMATFTPKRPEPSPPIVIVDIDEDSLKAEGRWPWSRDKTARLVQALQQQGVALTGFDVVFSEPEVNPVDVILGSSRLSPAARADLNGIKPAYDADARLAGSLGSNVVLGYILDDAHGITVGALPPAFLELDDKDAAALAVTRMPDYTSNLALLMQKAVSAGFFSTVPDADGVIRRSPLLIRRGNSLYTALSLEMAKVYLNAPSVDLKTVVSGNELLVDQLSIGNRIIHTDGTGLALVPYKGRARSYPYYSATRVLHGDIPPGALKGAIALVGTSALGLVDIRTTPLDNTYPGVEVHANLLDTILQSTPGHDMFYYRPDWEPGATLVLLLVSGLVLALWLPRLGPSLMLVVSVAWLSLLVLTNALLWKGAHFDLPLAILLLPSFTISLFNIGYGFLRVNSQKREIQGMFGQYVPPEHVARMLENPDTVSLEGEQREMTVLFSDIRSFTTISEGLSAAALKSMLNRFFTPITQIIFDNNGTIDKYVGDMVMAFWNAPLTDEHHAHHAISAALAMLARIEELKPEFAADGLPEINVGIGLNTGVMNVGDMGSSYRRAYTVLGDAVNLGSRLEGATKQFGVRLLVGERTHELAPEYLYREVGRLRVKGKHKPVTVYEPVCLQADASESRRARVENFNQAMQCIYAQDWQQADSLLSELLAQDPERKLYQIILAHVAELRGASLPADWDGVFELTSK